MDLIIANRNTPNKNQMLDYGLWLAETADDQGGWASYFNEDDGLAVEDEWLRAGTAVMLENCKMDIASRCGRLRSNSEGQQLLTEATRSALVGGFSDYLFPIIRAAFPVNAVNELVSVQPTTRRIATIVFWNYMLGTNKGTYQAGQRIFDANVGRTDAGTHYSDEVIEGETVTLSVLSSGNTVVTGTLSHADGGGVRPNTVQIAATTAGGSASSGSGSSSGASQSTVVFYDDGNGNLTSPNVTVSSGTINYTTGVFTVTISGATFNTATTTATYEWDSEGSPNLPEMDVQITTSTAEVQRRAIKINYSIEAMQDVQNEFGVQLEPNLIASATEQMNYEVARQLITLMWNAAPVTSVFPLTGPTNFSQQQYFGDFIYYLNRASNNIWERTQKGTGNFMVVDSPAASMIQSLPNNMFQAAPPPPSVQGLHYIGLLNNQWRVYKDLLLKNQKGAAAAGNILMGFKGRDFFEAGLVYAPYQALYSTDSIPTASFLVQKGLACRYATKLVNPNFYTRVSLAA